MKQEEIAKLFPAHIRQALLAAHFDMDQVYEIRLRVNAPLIVIYQGKEYFLTREGEFSREESQGCFVRAEDLKETMEYVSSYSMYAFEEEIRQGFITIQGGHRVGIAGKTVLEGDRIKSVKYISYINLRLSHQIKGCASPILPYIIKNGRICHTLIISPPRCGKTTLLRDLIRQVSSGSSYMPGVSVGVVDERSEIAGSIRGIPQNDVGLRTDVLDGCPKAEGMMLLVRSMSPEILAVDEIGGGEDLSALKAAVRCGCRILATIHCSDLEELWSKPGWEDCRKQKIFSRYVVLENREGIRSFQVSGAGGEILFDNPDFSGSSAR